MVEMNSELGSVKRPPVAEILSRSDDLVPGFQRHAGLRSIATKARRIGVERPVFEEAVRECSSFATRADDNERFAPEAGTRWDLHRLDNLISEVPYQCHPPHLRPGGNKTRRANSRARIEPSIKRRQPNHRRGCSPARRR